MQKPRKVKTYCPYCKKHTEHKVTQSKTRTPGSKRPLGKSAKKRRDFGKGCGNLGTKGSKPPLGKWKLTGKKTSKKTDFRYQCKECKKTHTQKSGFRAKRIEFK